MSAGLAPRRDAGGDCAAGTATLLVVYAGFSLLDAVGNVKRVSASDVPRRDAGVDCAAGTATLLAIWTITFLVFPICFHTPICSPKLPASVCGDCL